MRVKNEVTVDREAFKRAVAWTRRGKVGAKVVAHARYVALQMAEVAISKTPFADNPANGELWPPP